MQFTVMLTGDNPQAIQEMRNMLEHMLSSVCRVKHARLDKVAPEDADVFLCGLSVFSWARQVLPREKILITEPYFTKQFFKDVESLPPHAVVGMPHSNSFRTNTLIQSLRNLGHTTQTYLPILPTQPESVQKDRLAQSDIIIGTDLYLDYYLSPKLGFAELLRPGVRVIKGKRDTKPEYICRIINWLKDHYVRKIQQLIGEAAPEADLDTVTRLMEIPQRGQIAEGELNKITAQIIEKGRDPETALSKEEINALIKPPMQALAQLVDDLTA